MSKNKLPKEIFIVAAGSKEAKKVKLGTFLSAFKKDYEMPSEQTEKLIQHYLTKGGAEEPDVENIEDANERKWVISCWKALVKIMLRHEKEVKAEMDKAEAEKKAEEEEKLRKAEEGKNMALAVVRGGAIAEKVTEIAAVDGDISKVLGKKFTYSNGRVEVAQGVRLSSEDASQAISAFGNITDGMGRVRGRWMLAFGSLVKTIRASFGDEAAEAIITNAVTIGGQAKHTVQEAERVADFILDVFGDKEIPSNLTYTAMQEMKNYLRDRDGKLKLKPAQIVKLAEKVSAGHVEQVVEKASKETFELRKPLSTLQTRELCKEALGIKPGEGEKTPARGKGGSAGGGEVSRGYFYIQEDGTTYKSLKLSKTACAVDGIVVIDVRNECLLDASGEPIENGEIQMLPKEMCDPEDEAPKKPEQPEQEPQKQSKAKDGGDKPKKGADKPKEPAKKKTQVPD